MKFLAPKFMAVDMVRAGRGRGQEPGPGAGSGAGPACAAGDRRAHRAHHVTAEGGPPVAMETASPWQPRGRHGERAAAAAAMLAAPPHREGREGRRCSLLPGPEAAQWNKVFCSPKGVVGVIICPQMGRVGVLVMGKLPTEGGGWGWFLLKCVCVFVNKWEKSKTLRPASAHVYMGEPVPLLSPMSRLS